MFFNINNTKVIRKDSLKLIIKKFNIQYQQNEQLCLTSNY